MTTHPPKIARTLEHWRELPVLSIAECATLAGISRREMEGHLGDAPLRTLRIGRRRMVVTESFRAWLGEDVAGERAAASRNREAQAIARQALERIG